MASLSTCHLGLWLGWQILLNLVKFLRLYDLDRIDEIGKTPISQVQSVSGLPIYSTLKLWLNKNNKSTASVCNSVVE